MQNRWNKSEALHLHCIIAKTHQKCCSFLSWTPAPPRLTWRYVVVHYSWLKWIYYIDFNKQKYTTYHRSINQFNSKQIIYFIFALLVVTLSCPLHACMYVCMYVLYCILFVVESSIQKDNTFIVKFHRTYCSLVKSIKFNLRLLS